MQLHLGPDVIVTPDTIVHHKGDRHQSPAGRTNCGERPVRSSSFLLSVIAHIEQGWSLREIASRFGCSVTRPSSDVSTPVAMGDGAHRRAAGE